MPELQVMFSPPFWAREIRYQSDAHGEQTVYPLRPHDFAAPIDGLGLAIRHADGSVLLIPCRIGRPHPAELDALCNVHWMPI